jgi:predicted nucleic acid-binding Zn ribbon protein
MRYNNKHKIDDFIQIFLKQYGLEKGYQEYKVLEAWKKMMGPTINSRTTNLQLQDKTIYVRLSSAPLKQELSMSKSKILENLKSELPGADITDIRFL